MKLKQEIPLILIILLPILYLGYIWSSLPPEVPIHWNSAGEIDKYAPKSALVLVAIFMPLLVYLLFIAIPKIDPKSQLSKMGSKFQNIKFLMTTFMSVLALFIIYSSKSQSLTNPNYVILGMGVLFIILGNYFKTIKPNYFLGIRTPWTLESETVWRSTHKLAGKMWFIGGIAIVLASLVLSKEVNLTVFLVITAIISLIPVGYSYLQYKNEKPTA